MTGFGRAAVVLGVPVLLGLLGWYSYRYHPYRNLRDALRRPQAFDGRVVTAGAEVTIVSVDDTSFVIRQLGHTFRVRGHLPGARPGEYIALEVVFRENADLELVRGRVLTGRRAKIWISVLPLLAVVALFFVDFRFDWRTLLFVRRRTGHRNRTSGRRGRGA